MNKVPKMKLNLLGLSPVLCAMIFAGTLTTSSAHAQEEAVGEMSVQRFSPAFGPRNYLSVSGARTEGEWAWSTAVVFDYARDPFVMRGCAGATDCSGSDAQDVHVVQDLFTWNVMGTVTPVSWVQIGLRVPVVFSSGEGLDTTTGRPPADGLSAIGVGDPAIEGKFRFFGKPNDPIVLGAAAGLSAPLGHITAEGGYVGDTPMSARLAFIFDGNFGPLMVAANVIGVYRGESNMGASSTGSELRYGAAVGVKPVKFLTVFAEAFGATRFSDTTGTNAVEVLGGVRYIPPGLGLAITAGGGAGVVPGIGTPLARAVFGVSYGMAAGEADSDGDGVIDKNDQCPEVKEDLDKIADTDGCPETDADLDNVPDERDLCPEQSETFNKIDDTDGCPDGEGDKDGDGVKDAHDNCPDKPGTAWEKGFVGCPDADEDGVPDSHDQCAGKQEDMDGFEDTDGCPDLDHDHDGVLDTSDNCIGEPEVHNGVDDTDGCPDSAPDRDGDGIPDAKDRCKRKAETLNAEKDSDGCPENFRAKMATVTMRRVELVKPQLKFSAGQLTDSQSLKALDALAAGLVNQQGIFLVEVTVTTSQADAAVGDARAKAVVAHLINKGVDKRRLQSKTEVGTKPGVRFEILWSVKKKKPAPPPAPPK